MNRRNFLNVIGLGALIALIPLPTKLKGRAIMGTPIVYAPHVPLITSLEFVPGESLGNHFGLNVEEDLIEELQKEIAQSMQIPKDILIWR